MKFFLCVLGVVLMIEGMPYFGMPGQIKKMMRMALEMPDDALRKFGFVLMITGLLLAYLGNR